jgi:hypothetical protein
MFSAHMIPKPDVGETLENSARRLIETACELIELVEGRVSKSRSKALVKDNEEHQQDRSGGDVTLCTGGSDRFWFSEE